MQFPAVIELRRSLLLLFLVGFAHGISALAIATSPLPWMFRALLLAFVAVSATRLSLGNDKFPRLILSSKTELACETFDGKRVVVHVCPDSTVFNQLMVLRLHVGDESSVTNLVLLPDQMTSEQFRQLRIWLRWQALSGGASVTS